MNHPLEECVRQRFFCLVAILSVLFTSCSNVAPAQQASEPSVTATPDPTATPIPPAPEASATAFLQAWEQRDYGTMYTLLSPRSQEVLEPQTFTRRYENALASASVLTVTTALQSVLREERHATAAYRVTLDTALFGTLSSSARMTLTQTAETWGIDWDASLIWPELEGDKYFRTRYSIPVRATIYDTKGLGLATQGAIVSLGVIPSQIADEQAMLDALGSITGLSQETIREQYASSNPEWKIPIADIPAQVSVQQNEILSSLEGVYREEKTGRTYPGGEIAAHVVGWVAPVPAEELIKYRSLGYRGDEMVGVAGLEGWGEPILAGQHGGTLSIVTGAGEVVTQLRESEAVAGRAIHTTIDRELQRQLQEIFGRRTGSIVVLDVKSGALRALVSGPSFDPNVFVGPTSDAERANVLADPDHPLINRALQGTYPTGSVFKIVTMSAGMEAGRMDPLQTAFDCPGYWDGLGRGARKYCWKADGHGLIALQDGLSASCNVVFYNVGHALHELDPGILSQFGVDFGLGQSTGLVGLVEESGLMPSPAWKEDALGESWYTGDTINLAIGQGYLRVTPLQVARMMGAVANGGTLYSPYIIEGIEGSAQQPEQVTEPAVTGSLPISSEHLAALQKGLLGVTSDSAIGTATHRFTGLSIPVAGKTGTAEAGAADAEPHSWFAAYAPADDPEIAVVVVAENAGEGSTVAAPLARQVVEAYYGLPVSDLPPEAAEDYEPPTPTPEE